MIFLIIFIYLQVFLTYFQKISATTGEEKYFRTEPLTPYVHQHGSKFNHRFIRDCHQEKYGSVPHVLYPSHQSSKIDFPFLKIKRFVKNAKAFPPRQIRGHYIKISNPLKTLSVLEPDQQGGCALNIRQTVTETARKNKCLLAVNAGYFDTKQGKCLGNVISDGRKAHNSNGIQNAHFGLTNDGNIFTGYVSEEFYLSDNLKQLVGGVVWILRNSTSFVNASKFTECEDTEETGSMDEFINILSARTVVGHNAEGNVVIVQVDGRSGLDGANLLDMEMLLKEFGLINAINLDGGGSSTLVINGTTANYPYDDCPDDKTFSCDRKVSTILCVHSPNCDPTDCNDHGTCSMGECVCDENWLSPQCDKLFCGTTNCSDHGVCLHNGCLCHPGFFGKDCNQTCHEGWHGSMCAKQCACVNSIGCDRVTGACKCRSGFSGDMCEKPCPVGYFGINCQFKCQCNSSCCDPVNGACNILYNSSSYTYNHIDCMTEYIIKTQHLVKDNPNEKWKWYMSMIILGIITAVCISSCLLISCVSCTCFFQNDQVLCFKKTRKVTKKRDLLIPSGFISDSSSSDNENLPLNDFHKK